MARLDKLARARFDAGLSTLVSRSDRMVEIRAGPMGQGSSSWFGVVIALILTALGLAICVAACRAPASGPSSQTPESTMPILIPGVFLLGLGALIGISSSATRWLWGYRIGPGGITVLERNLVREYEARVVGTSIQALIVGIQASDRLALRVSPLTKALKYPLAVLPEAEIWDLTGQVSRILGKPMVLVAQEAVGSGMEPKEMVKTLLAVAGSRALSRVGVSMPGPDLRGLLAARGRTLIFNFGRERIELLDGGAAIARQLAASEIPPGAGSAASSGSQAAPVLPDLYTAPLPEGTELIPFVEVLQVVTECQVAGEPTQSGSGDDERTMYRYDYHLVLVTSTRSSLRFSRFTSLECRPTQQSQALENAEWARSFYSRILSRQ